MIKIRIYTRKALKCTEMADVRYVFRLPYKRFIVEFKNFKYLFPRNDLTFNQLSIKVRSYQFIQSTRSLI